MHITIVVAASENDVIGAEGGIPWRLPDDQRYFKQLTLGQCIVMGRGTHESIGRLLPGRETVIVSRNPDYAVEGATVAGSFEEALEQARREGRGEIFVVGGAELYRRSLPLADRLHLTRVHAEIAGDAHFPDLDALEQSGWKLAEETPHAADERHAHSFTIQRWERSTDDRA
jgi:dihydrofolate reductase